MAKYTALMQAPLIFQKLSAVPVFARVYLLSQELSLNEGKAPRLLPT